MFTDKEACFLRLQITQHQYANNFGGTVVKVVGSIPTRGLSAWSFYVPPVAVWVLPQSKDMHG